MSISSIGGLQSALSHDLRVPGEKKVKLVDDAVRGVFTMKRDGIVFEFSHKQRDLGFWVGTKHYGSGPSSRIRIRRTPVVNSSKVSTSKIELA
jgi:hypothetical protein